MADAATATFWRHSQTLAQATPCPQTALSYVLEPLVAGELGEATVMDASTHPPLVERVQYRLDAPTDQDVIESFPVVLVSEALANDLQAARLRGFRLAAADVRPSIEYTATYGDAPHKDYRWLQLTRSVPTDCWLDGAYRLCVSDEMFAVISAYRIERCEVSRLL